MGRNSYLGGHTVVIVGPDGTYWGTGDQKPKRKKNTRSEPTNRSATDQQVRAQELRDLEAAARDQAAQKGELASFIHACVQCWLANKLTATHPKAPKFLVARVREAGGNWKWIARSKQRQTSFHAVVCKVTGRRVPFENLWKTTAVSTK